jgi:glycosyltransferase involved in cell wall biosynthesis
MKILFYCSGFLTVYGGVEESISALSEFFVRKNHSVFILSGFGSKNVSKHFTVIKFPFIPRKYFHFIPFLEKLFPLSEFEALSMLPFTFFLLFLIHPDIILSNQLAETLPSLMLGIPSVMISQSNDRMRINSFKKVDKVIVNDPRSIHKLKEYSVDSKLILNGFDNLSAKEDNCAECIINFKKNFKFNRNEKVILTIARLDQNKRINLLIEAVSVMDIPVSLIIIGDGPELKNLKKQASSLNSEHHVFFLKPMPHDKLRKYYQICDVFTLPSKIEGLPLVLIEALSWKKTVVVNSTPEKRYILGDYGIYTNVENKYEYSRSLSDARELEVNVDFEKYISKFKWDAISEEYLKLFAEITENKNK